MKKNKILLAVLFSQICFGGLGLYAKNYTFDDLYSSTLKNNPELLKLEEEYKRSELDIKDAYAGLGPTVDLQVSGTYMPDPTIGAIYLNVDDIMNSIKWPSGMKPTSRGQSIKVYDGMEKTLYNFQLSILQPIFTWGKITNAIKLYKQVAEIKHTQMEAQIQQLETEIKTRLVTLVYLGQINNLIEEEKEYVERLVAVTENAEKTGMLLHQDVVDARIQAKELEIAQQDLLEQINNQLLEIIRSTGIDDLSLEQIDFNVDDALIQKIMDSDRTEMQRKALSENQLSIKMLVQLKEVNQIAEKIARGYENWKPDVALQASIGYGGSRAPLVEPNWLRKDDYTTNISIGIKTTIWDGGKKLRDISRKESESKTADINQLDASLSIRKTLNEQWNTIDVCTMKIEYQDLKIEASDSKIQQKETIYKTGYGSETDVLNEKIQRCNLQIEKEKQALTRAVACMTIDFLCR